MYLSTFYVGYRTVEVHVFFFRINILKISRCIYGLFTLVIGLLRCVYFFELIFQRLVGVFMDFSRWLLDC